MPNTAPGVPGPPTNLNIGMGYWGAPIPGMHGKVSTPVPGVFAQMSRDGGHSQPWLQVCVYLRFSISHKRIFWSPNSKLLVLQSGRERT